MNASYLGKNGAVTHLLKLLGVCGKKHVVNSKHALDALTQLVKSSEYLSLEHLSNFLSVAMAHRYLTFSLWCLFCCFACQCFGQLLSVHNTKMATLPRARAHTQELCVPVPVLGLF